MGSRNQEWPGTQGFPGRRALAAERLAGDGHIETAVTGEHGARVDIPIHKDPFDRILVAQALIEGITLVTADAVVARCPGPVRAV